MAPSEFDSRGSETSYSPGAAAEALDFEEPALEFIEDDLITEEEAAVLLKLKPGTLTVWRSDSKRTGTLKGPRHIKLGRQVFYRRLWIREYLASCEVTP